MAKLITLNGIVLFEGSYIECMTRLHARENTSAFYAMTKLGYKIDEDEPSRWNPYPNLSKNVETIQEQ